MAVREPTLVVATKWNCLIQCLAVTPNSFPAFRRSTLLYESNTRTWRHDEQVSWILVSLSGIELNIISFISHEFQRLRLTTSRGIGAWVLILWLTSGWQVTRQIPCLLPIVWNLKIMKFWETVNTSESFSRNSVSYWVIFEIQWRF